MTGSSAQSFAHHDIEEPQCYRDEGLKAMDRIGSVGIFFAEIDHVKDSERVYEDVVDKGGGDSFAGIRIIHSRGRIHEKYIIFGTI